MRLRQNFSTPLAACFQDFVADFSRCSVINSIYDRIARAYASGGVGVKKSLELDILQKLYYLRKGDKLFPITFCLSICQLNANTTK